MNTILFFKGEHCIQCKALFPQFEKEVERLGIENYEVVDAEESPLAQEFGVRSVPHIVIIDENREIVARGHAMDMIPQLKEYK